MFALPEWFQKLKYNFQGGGTVQLSGLPFISCIHVSIVVFQFINDRLNVLNLISLFFFKFVKFCKNIQHCEFVMVKCEI